MIVRPVETTDAWQREHAMPSSTCSSCSSPSERDGWQDSQLSALVLVHTAEPVLRPLPWQRLLPQRPVEGV